MKTPRFLVDKKTNAVKRFETFTEKFRGKFLPNFLRFSLIGLKIVVLAAALTTPLWIPCALVGAAMVMTKLAGNIVGTAVGQDLARLAKSRAIDPSTPEGYAALEKKTQGMNPGFAKGYVTVAAEMGMSPPPVIVSHYDMFGGEDPLGAIWAGVSEMPGGKPLFFINDKLLEISDPAELRTTIAHEFTHIRLGHPRAHHPVSKSRPVSAVLSTALFITAVATPFLPVVPVALGLAAVHYGRKYVNAMESRYREKLADRGAAMVTGDPAHLASALEKMEKIGQKIEHLSQVLSGKKPSDKPALTSGLTHLFNDKHPYIKTRQRRADNFEKRYPDYCAARQKTMAAALN